MTSNPPAHWPAMTVVEAKARLGAPGELMEIEEVEIRGLRMKAWKNQPPTLRAIVECSRQYGDAVWWCTKTSASPTPCSTRPRLRWRRTS